MLFFSHKAVSFGVRTALGIGKYYVINEGIFCWALCIFLGTERCVVNGICPQSGLVKATEHFLPELNFPLSLLSVPVMPGKIIFATFSQLISNCVPLYSKLKHWEILRIGLQTEPSSSSVFNSLQHPYQNWQHEPALVLPWLHERMNSGCASSLPPKPAQVRPGPGLTTHCRMHLFNQITASLLCFLAQQNPGFSCNKLSAVSSSTHCFPDLQPPLCLLTPSFNLWFLPTTAFSSISNSFIIFSLFSVSIPVTVSTNSPQFPQSHFFIPPPRFLSSHDSKSHIWRLSLPLCLIDFHELNKTFILLDVGTPSESSHEDGRWGEGRILFWFSCWARKQSGEAPFIDIFQCLSSQLSVGLPPVSTSWNVQAW